jgi:hypothetical protein
MKQSDLVRIKIKPTDLQRRVEMTGLILERVESHTGESVFRVLVDGSPDWFLLKGDMRVIK